LAQLQPSTPAYPGGQQSLEEEGEAPAKRAAENGDPAAMAGSPRGSGQIAVRPNGREMAI
jgi:hypothetical protein